MDLTSTAIHKLASKWCANVGVYSDILVSNVCTCNKLHQDVVHVGWYAVLDPFPALQIMM